MKEQIHAINFRGYINLKPVLVELGALLYVYSPLKEKKSKAKREKKGFGPIRT